MESGEPIEVIAHRKILYSPKGIQERKILTIQLGKPYWIESRDMAGCPVIWDAIHDATLEIIGADLLQAVHLASDIDPWLRDLSQSYDFFFVDGEPYFD